MSKVLGDAPSRAKHRAGPWECKHSISGNQFEVISAEGYVIAIFPASRPNAKANAHLIASAPDLLEALKECLPILEGLDTLRHLQAHFTPLDKARAAIAKAEGRP